MAGYPTTTVAFYKNESDDSFYLCEMLHIPRVGELVQIMIEPNNLISGRVIEVDWGLDFTKEVKDRPESGFQVVHIYLDT